VTGEMVLVRRSARPRPRIMGILNVTPDSFSDGGRWASVDDAIEHGARMHEQGADIVDVGGESTRPGAERVAVDEEQQRVLPVVRELSARGIRVSIDTLNASTAAAAAEAGAAIVNDVSGGLADEEMFRTIAGLEVDYIVSHWRGHSDHMNDLARYDEVVGDVRTEIQARVAELIVWGVDERRLIVDPGLGGAWGVRVHDIESTAAALAVWTAWEAGATE
jgi:dihydropteroate synthase